MTDLEILEMIKADLNHPRNQDALLTQMQAEAEWQIGMKGIVVDKSDPAVCGVIRMWTAWLFRKRASSDPSMPRMLEMQMKDLLFHQKMSGKYDS